MIENKKQKNFVIGTGEVGSAIVKLLQLGNNYVYTIDIDTEIRVSRHADFIHICFPYGSEFINNVIYYYKALLTSKSTVVIIHSTVYPGTTDKLSKLIDNIVYSPVRGKHPNLVPDNFKYAKFVAASDSITNIKTCNLFKEIGLKTESVRSMIGLEVAKHYCTLMYGYSLAMTQHLVELSARDNFDPKIVFDFINETGEITKDRKIYPYIEPIGGHCVLQNAEMISDYSKMAQMLIHYNNEYKHQYPEKVSIDR